MEKSALEMLPPTATAFVGDAAYSLYVRKRIVGVAPNGTLHTACSEYVNAKAQARVFAALESTGFFTQEESDVARRARNAHLHSRAKSATSADYHKATALESVIGYLELSGNVERLNEILDKCFSVLGSDISD